VIESVAQVPRLLVASDFDGTLAPIADHPDDAVVLPRSEAALRRLAKIPQTWVAIVSGRRRDELVARFGEGEIILVGEHGADWGDESAADSPLLARIRQKVAEAATSTAGVVVEQKKRSVTFHYRQAVDPEPVVEGLRRWAVAEGVKVLEGKAVLELTVASTEKGDAVAALRREIEADAIVFLGDDITDESVFETLEAEDVGIHIGPGPSAARAFIALPDDVPEVLEAIASIREDS
jgi:trehalose 6-phosphate phosphatase